jgi:hypothetical protein
MHLTELKSQLRNPIIHTNHSNISYGTVICGTEYGPVKLPLVPYFLSGSNKTEVHFRTWSRNINLV